MDQICINVKPSLFTVEDHVSENSTFLISDFELIGQNIYLTYIINSVSPFPPFKEVNRLTVNIFAVSGRNMKSLDFRVKFLSYEHFRLSWEDTNNILKMKVKFEIVD